MTAAPSLLEHRIEAQSENRGKYGQVCRITIGVVKAFVLCYILVRMVASRPLQGLFDAPLKGEKQ
jgi:hypothetical protein